MFDVSRYTNIITVAAADNFGKVKELLEKHLKTVESLVADINTLTLKYFEVAMETARKYWNTLPFKTFINNKFWSEIINEVIYDTQLSEFGIFCIRIITP